METLTDLANKHGTDKGAHTYTEIYAKLFEPMRDKPITLLEIGVQFGNSMNMWREYFPHAKLVGMDSVDNGMTDARNDWHFVLGDQNNIADLARVAGLGPFDIIIDDGSHEGGHIVKSLEWLANHLKPGGYYVVEDLHAPGCTDAAGFSRWEPWGYFNKLIRESINGPVPAQSGNAALSPSPWESVCFYRSLVVLKRKL